MNTQQQQQRRNKLINKLTEFYKNDDNHDTWYIQEHDHVCSDLNRQKLEKFIDGLIPFIKSLYFNHPVKVKTKFYLGKDSNDEPIFEGDRIKIKIDGDWKNGKVYYCDKLFEVRLSMEDGNELSIRHALLSNLKLYKIK